MTSTTVRRTALAASAAALALLATACGGSSDDGAKGDGGKSPEAGTAASASTAPEAAPAKALTAAELKKAALAQADVKSGKVTPLPAKDDIAQDGVKVDKAECAPLAYLEVGTYTGKPAATEKRSWQGDPKKPAAGASEEEQFMAGMDVTKVVVTLATYEDGGAEQAMKDLNDAVGKCAGGYTATAQDTPNKALKVTKTEAPQGADEAVAVTLSLDMEDSDPAPFKGVAVRKGSTVAYFTAVNFAALANASDFEFPTEIVQAQLAKLA
ncbi:hypothetical protein ACL02U_00985 [Streptomyces sp. MS06]|uniref:hypothetical protein n=1 Tax=Streptomyces sp. MS06 TaxID=3385974 RepID=UPI00399F5541